MNGIDQAARDMLAHAAGAFINFAQQAAGGETTMAADSEAEDALRGLLFEGFGTANRIADALERIAVALEAKQ